MPSKTPRFLALAEPPRDGTWPSDLCRPGPRPGQLSCPAREPEGSLVAAARGYCHGARLQSHTCFPSGRGAASSINTPTVHSKHDLQGELRLPAEIGLVEEMADPCASVDGEGDQIHFQLFGCLDNFNMSGAG